MTHIAKGYVYRNLDEDENGDPKPGYVGRSPRGNFVLVARPGNTLSDDEVAALGLDDLEDHTDYDKVIDAANKKGAPVTARHPDSGEVLMKVKGKWATTPEALGQTEEDDDE